MNQLSTLRRVSTGLLAGAMVSCAPAAPSAEATPDVPTGPRWSGNLQPTQQRTGALAVTGQNRVFGNVEIEPAQNRPEWMRVRLTVAMPTPGSRSAGWAVLPGRCGSNGLPLLGYEQFPLIDIGNNGRGEVSVEVPLQLTAGGSYHTNVYVGGHQPEHVISCANIRFQPGGPAGR